MHKRKFKEKLKRLMDCITVHSAVSLGLILLLLVMMLGVRKQTATTTDLAEATTKTLKQQCVSFDRLTTSDQTRSLFRLSDMMREFRLNLLEESGQITDKLLEQFVDRTRLTGVALLNGELRLEASGYTRQFRNGDLAITKDGKSFADILDYPAKIYLERVESDGEFYDICALARLDAPGIVVGFYHQPATLISGTQSDLESLVSGLYLERNGHYAIVEGGQVRASSADSLKDAQVSDQQLLQELSLIRKDGRLHILRADESWYWGYRSGWEGYSIYIYYPALAVLSGTLGYAAAFALTYCFACLVYFAARNRTLYENWAALNRSNHDLRKTVRMLRALETIYFSLFYVDLEDDTYETIYMAPWLRPAIPETGIYTQLKQRFLDGFVLPEYQAEIDRRMSLGFVRDTLARENLTDVRKSFYTDYQAIRGAATPWCRVTATAVDYDETGKPRHFLALIQDVDKEKTKEAAYQAQILREAHEAKVANNAKSEFLRRISHDIRTPLNGIQGCIEMSAAYPQDLQIQEDSRRKATAAVHTLMELVNSVLDMSKLESGEIVLEQKTFCMTELLKEVNDVMEPQAVSRNIRYELMRKTPLAVDRVVGSPMHIAQVLMNLVSNAIKYGKSGGCVRMNTAVLHTDGKTVTYEFTCEDDGIGMSPEFQQHMYEPFTQEAEGARTTFEGTGLGLSIVKKLVDAMGGRIICRSQRGVGTTFHVQLTLDCACPSEDGGEQPDSPGDGCLKNVRILLAEDNELNMEIAEMFLQEKGAQVVKAWNGQQALNIFAASPPGYFDLILMDIMMPVMDGLEAARAIRGLKRPDAGTVPISAMSANAFDDDIERCREAGMDGHIAKPMDDRKLLATVQKLLRKES